MKLSHVRILLLPVLAAMVLLTACDSGDEAGGDAAFGNGLMDRSQVLARVGDLEITQQQMELRRETLSADQRRRFSGEDGERSLLRFMVDEVLLYREAQRLELAADPVVAQQLVDLRRSALIGAYKNDVLFKDLEPAESDVREHYENNKDRYTNLGSIKVRHIQCETRDQADAAYEALQKGGRQGAFPYVCSEYSRNFMTGREGGELGWMNEGGFVRFIPYGKVFSRHIFGWEIGIHPPAFIGEHWHVVEILNRKEARQLTLNEIRDRVKQDFMPSLRNQKQEDKLKELREAEQVELLGKYAPGMGRSADQIFQHGVAAGDPGKQIELFDLILAEYPESEFVPKALFMKANVYLDAKADKHRARFALQTLLNDHPDSDLADQARYMLNNLSAVDFSKPTSIQELKDMAR